MRRREFMMLLGGAAGAWPRAARAQEAYRRFTPLLMDLPGWTGTQPVGTEEERKGGRVITASRGYERGDARFNAFIISGTASLATGRDDGVYITIRPTHKSTSTIDGFQVMTNATPVFVQIVITLGPDAIFHLIFNNVAEDEAMAIAQKFDWKGIRALLN
jgi:hypothetical protein